MYQEGNGSVNFKHCPTGYESEPGARVGRNRYCAGNKYRTELIQVLRLNHPAQCPSVITPYALFVRKRADSLLDGAIRLAQLVRVPSTAVSAKANQSVVPNLEPVA